MESSAKNLRDEARNVEISEKLLSGKVLIEQGQGSTINVAVIAFPSIISLGRKASRNLALREKQITGLYSL